MKKVSVDVSGHSNVTDEAIVERVQAAFAELKAACEAANMGPLKAECVVTPVGGE